MTGLDAGGGSADTRLREGEWGSNGRRVGTRVLDERGK